MLLRPFKSYNGRRSEYFTDMALTILANHKQYLHTNGNRSCDIKFFIPELSHNIPLSSTRIWASSCDSVIIITGVEEILVSRVLQSTGHGPRATAHGQWLERSYRGAQERPFPFASHTPEDVIRTNFRNSDFNKFGRLMKSKITWRIWDSHSGGYEHFCLLGYNAV
jgi:hypothetical protein